MVKLLILEVGDIVYNPKYNGFHEIREIKNKTMILGGCCVFLDDAKTIISSYLVSIKYLTKLKPVYKIHKFMERNNSLHAWKTTSSKENTTYLFYADKHILKDTSTTNGY